MHCDFRSFQSMHVRQEGLVITLLTEIVRRSRLAGDRHWVIRVSHNAADHNKNMDWGNVIVEGLK